MISKRFSYNESSPPYVYSASQAAEIEIVRNKIDAGAFSLQETTCPCGGDDFGEVATTERYGLPLKTVLCDDCGSLRFGKYLTDDSLANFYINHYQSMYGRLNDIPSYFTRQGIYGTRVFESYRSALKPDSTVLEIGCGAGGALNKFSQEGFAVYGCEYSQILVNHANENGLENVYQGSIFDIEDKLPSSITFDLIYIHHVFEHVSNPAALLRKCKNLLSEHGKIVIGVPDFMKIDQYDNPGCDLMLFLHIAHKYNFTADCFLSLANQAEMKGKVVFLHPDFPTPWSVQPELWYEFSAGVSSGSQGQKKGKEVYEYLASTERLFANKTRPGEKVKLRKKIIAKLKKLLKLRV